MDTIDVTALTATDGLGDDVMDGKDAWDSMTVPELRASTLRALALIVATETELAVLASRCDVREPWLREAEARIDRAWRSR